MTGRLGGTKFRQAGAGTPYPAELANVSTGPDGKEVKYYGPPPLGISAENLNKLVAEREAMKRRGMAGLSGRPVGEEWDVAGGLGSLAPGTAVYKTISSLLPKTLQETSKYLSGRTLGRMIAGGGTAALTIPDTSGDQDYFSNLGIKTGIGAATPVGVATLGSAAKTIGNTVKSGYGNIRDAVSVSTKEGPTKIAEKHIYNLAKEGGEPAAQQTVKSLFGTKGILSKPTSADSIAAGNIANPSERFGGPLVRLQSELSSLPETTTRLKGIDVAQEQLRKAAIQSIAKGNTEESALLERGVAAAKNYKKAYERFIKPDDEINVLMNDPFIEKAIPKALDIARSEGINPKAHYTRFLHLVKSGLDQQLKGDGRTALEATERKAIEDIKKKLVSWIEKKNTDYKFAREEHQRLSRILNRTQVRDVLEKALTGKSGEERVVQFQNAVSDVPKTFKKATGYPRFGKLEDVLTAPEAETVKKVTQELEREAMALKMIREVNVPGAVKPVTGGKEDLPSMLWTPSMIGKWLIRISGKEGDKNVNRVAAEILADPKRAAEIISRTPGKFHQAVKDVVSKIQQYSSDPTTRAALIQGVNESMEKKNGR